MRGWVISNRGWIDYKHNNLLLTLNEARRADRIVGYFLGADDYPMFRNGVAEVSVPMSDAVAKDQGNSRKYTTALFSLEPGETKTGFLPFPERLQLYCTGGLPVGTGWMPEGIWAAMALDNFSSVYLRMGKCDMASAFLYPVLNHASPLVTWCEERGKEKGSAEKARLFLLLKTRRTYCIMMFSLNMNRTDRYTCISAHRTGMSLFCWTS